MRASGYIRVSSTDQVEGTSLDSQKAAIQAYCAMEAIELVATYQDAGSSGSIPLKDRPEGSKLVTALANGEADSVIICKLDRGFRSASDCLNNVETWERRGISLHILNLGGQTIDTGTPTGKFFITVMAGAAELERNLIAERCNEGRNARKREGRRVGEIPFGFDLDPVTNILVDNDQEQEAIRLMERLKAEGHSYRAIARELERRGITTKKGKSTWSARQVIRIMERAVA